MNGVGYGITPFMGASGILARSSGGGGGFVNEYSMTFDGNMDYFTGASTFSELDGGTKATFSMWVKPTSFSVGRILFSITKNTTVGNCQVMMFVDTSARLRGFVSTTGTYIYSNASVLTLNTWNHILFCIDLSQSPVSNRGRIFVDGLDQTGSGFSQLNLTTFPTSNSELYIGEDKNGYQNPFLNNIDEFAMWVGSDQRANVSDIYNGGVPFDLSTLATAPDHWWRMGDNDTWSGSQWTLTDNIGSYDLNSVSMPEEARLPITPNSYSQNSFVFDGINDFVSLGNDASRKVQTLTMSVWVKPTAFASDPILLNGHPSYGTQGIEIFWNFNNFRVRINGTSYGLGAGSGQNNWTHIVISYDGNTLKRMTNGVANSDVVVGATINYTNYSGLLIGRSVYGYALGFIDEVAFWDSDQSANFSTIYGNGVPTDILSLSPLNYYRMGESATWDGANWTFVDQGSGGNDGTSSTLPEGAKTGDQPYVL